MENITQIDLKSIDCKYIDEVITEQYEKAYSTILFSSNYVFKIFPKKDELYNEKAVKDEYDWDCSMPFLKPDLHKIKNPIGDELNILVMNRLPVQSCILFGLINQKLTTDTIIEVGQKILMMQRGYKRHNLSPVELYENYISNVQIQISFLNEVLSQKIKNQICDIIASSMCKNAFLKQENGVSCSLVHGNMFTGNIFFCSSDIVIIDPISVNHPSRFSYPDIDIATYLVDLKLLLTEENYNFCFYHITKLLPQSRIHLIKFYFLLKLLVRIRFAYVELKMPNLTHEINMNYRVAKIGSDILARYINELEQECLFL